MNHIESWVDDKDWEDDEEECDECGRVHCQCGYSDERYGYEWGCEFPDTCLMPGEHMRFECHTVEMVQAWEEEMHTNAS